MWEVALEPFLMSLRRRGEAMAQVSVADYPSRSRKRIIFEKPCRFLESKHPP